MTTGSFAAHRHGRRALRLRIAALAAAGLAVTAVAPVRAQAPGANAAIYTCVDASGKKLTSDRPIPECSLRTQRVLNPDGSTRRMLEPAQTADERAEAEARERDRAAESVARLDAIRHDRNLLARFPNEAAHARARAAALDAGTKSLRLSEARLAALASDRKPLVDEAEFYAGKKLPAKLKAQMDAVDVAAEAQRTLVANQQLEMARIDALYDQELERLKKLWGGAQPGSMGVLAGAKGASAPPRK